MDGAFPGRTITALLAFKNFDVKLNRLVHFHSQQVEWQRHFQYAVEAHFHRRRRHGLALAEKLNALAGTPRLVDAQFQLARFQETDA